MLEVEEAKKRAEPWAIIAGMSPSSLRAAKFASPLVRWTTFVALVPSRVPKLLGRFAVNPVREAVNFP